MEKISQMHAVFLPGLLLLFALNSNCAEPKPEKIVLQYYGGKSGFSVTFTKERFEVKYHAYMTKDANLKGATPPEDWAALLKAIDEKDFLPENVDRTHQGRVILTYADNREVLEFFGMSEPNEKKGGQMFLKIYLFYMKRARDE